MIPILHAQGPHHAIGFSLGREVGDRVAHMVANYRGMLEQTPEIKLTWPRAIVQARKYLPFALEYMPQYVEELRGMAEGSGVDFEDILVCNCLEELTSDMLFERCTVVAFNNDHTVDGHVYLGHNEDWLPHDQDLQYLVRAEPEGELPFLALAYGGLLCNIGFNAAGIAQCINSVYPTGVRLGIPRVFIGRAVLAAPRIGRAMYRAVHPRRAAGYNHLLADDNGELYNVEVASDRFDVLYGEDGFLTHANHYTSPRLRDFEEQPDQLTGSHVRNNRARRLAQQLIRRGKVRIEDVQAILSDHVNYPGSICSHAKDLPILDESVTIGSLVIDLNARTLWYCYGNPCEGEYAALTLTA
ncbi:MAG TPA: C45 family peptidase [Anaerolineae bacterium]|nr:C45 family peptidase [Anaerolineae bacterium]